MINILVNTKNLNESKVTFVVSLVLDYCSKVQLQACFSVAIDISAAIIIIISCRSKKYLFNWNLLCLPKYFFKRGGVEMNEVSWTWSEKSSLNKKCSTEVYLNAVIQNERSKKVTLFSFKLLVLTITLRNKFDALQKILETLTPNDEYENFVNAQMEAAAGCIPIKLRAKYSRGDISS